MDKVVLVGLASGIGGAIVGAVTTYYIYKHRVDGIVEKEINSLKATYKPDLVKVVEKETITEEKVSEPEEKVDISVIRTDYGEPITREDFQRAQLKYHNLVAETVDEGTIVAEIVEEEDTEGYVDPHDFDDEQTDALTGIQVYSFDDYLSTDSDINYPQVLLVYSYEEDTLMTEDDEVIKDHIRVIGKEAKRKLRKKELGGGDSLYVVNHNRQTVYEVYVEEN